MFVPFGDIVLHGAAGFGAPTMTAGKIEEVTVLDVNSPCAAVRILESPVEAVSETCTARPVACRYGASNQQKTQAGGASEMGTNAHHLAHR